MAKEKKRGPRNGKRGPLRTTGPGTPIMVRCHKPLLARLDRWRKVQKDERSRPDAMRQLAEAGLTAAGY